MNTTDSVIEVPHARLAYNITGQGAPLVQLHGLTSSRHRDEVLELNLAEDVSQRRVLRYDARGHGHSTGRAVPEDYTWPVLADDLDRVLAEFVGDAPLDAIGQSMGAATLLHAARRRPERFRSLTLVIPPTAWETRSAQQETYRASADLVETRGIETFTRMSEHLPRPPAAPPAPRTGPDVSQELMPSILRGAAKSDLPPLSELAVITAPTLILGWIDDQAHPLSTAEALAATLPNARLVVARTPQDSLTWGARAEEHITSCG